MAVVAGLSINNNCVTDVAAGITNITINYTDKFGACQIITEGGSSSGSGTSNLSNGIVLTTTAPDSLVSLTIQRNASIVWTIGLPLGGFGYSKIQTVTINDVTVSLQPKAFVHCTELTSCNLEPSKMTFPASLETWPKWVFYGCSKLQAFGSATFLTGAIKKRTTDSDTSNTLLFVAPGITSTLTFSSSTASFVAIAPTACASFLGTLIINNTLSPNITYIGEGAFYAVHDLRYGSANAGEIYLYASGNTYTEVHAHAFEYVGWDTNTYYIMEYGNSSATYIFIEARAFAHMKMDQFSLRGYTRPDNCELIQLDYAEAPSISGTASYPTQSWFFGVDCTGSLRVWTPMSGGLEDMFTPYFYYVTNDTKMTVEEK